MIPTRKEQSSDVREREPIYLMLYQLWCSLGSVRRKQCLLLLGLMLVAAVAEVISLGLVVPFVGALAAPDQLLSNESLVKWLVFLNITNREQLLLPMAVAFALATVLAGGIRFGLLWASTRVSNATGVDLGAEMYQRTLYQPYQIHVNRSSSEVLSGITLKTSAVISGVLLKVLSLISAVVITIAIFVTLMAINTFIALISFAVLGTFYLGVTFVVRRRLDRNSSQIAKEQTRVVRAVQEGLGGIRDIIIDATQKLYVDTYRHSERQLRRSLGSNTIIGSCPRFLLEASVIVFVVFLAYVISGSDNAAVLPMLGALAFGAQRLIPTLQQAYHSWATIAGSRQILADTLKLLKQSYPVQYRDKNGRSVIFENHIRLRSVSFGYHQEGPLVLEDVSLKITKGSRVGFVGGTGSGKSTLLDIIMGLLEPVRGQVLIDEAVLSTDNIRSWQAQIAHVPQKVYLSDTSIIENIAFGVPRERINVARVKEAAERARIIEFIESLPEGFETKVGERGVRLSGGQCQRIGIARALYKNAPVLILDEATSALDYITEKAVMDSINSIEEELTILIVAHRLTTVERCDRIFELRDGRIVAEGSYDELMLNSTTFQEMVRSA